MIIEYHRPTCISDALILLARKQPVSYPLGGGTVLNKKMNGHIAVVDLQSLGLGVISTKGSILQVGATVTLQGLLEYKGLSGDIYKAIEHEATYNLRQMATIAGKLVTSDGRSPFVTAMLALDASIEIHAFGAKPRQEKLGDWLPIREDMSLGELITMMSFSVNVHFSNEYM